MSKKTQNQEAFNRFMTEYLAQAEQRDRMRRTGYWALASLVLVLLAFSIWQTIFSAIHRPEETLSSYQGQYYQKQPLLQVQQKLYADKAPHAMVDTVKTAMAAKWLQDSVRNKEYPYRLELSDGRRVRVIFAHWLKLPQIAVEERLAQATWPSFSAILAGLGQGDYGQHRAYAFTALHDAGKPWFYAWYGVWLLVWLALGKGMLSSYNAGRDEDSPTFRRWGMALGLILAFWSAWAAKDAAIFWTNGWHTFWLPNGGYYESPWLMLFLWLSLWLSLVILGFKLSDVENSDLPAILAIIPYFILSVALGFGLYFGAKYWLGYLLGWAVAALGGWGSVLEIGLVVLFIIGLFTETPPLSAAQEEEQYRQQQRSNESKRARQEELNRINAGIQNWNNNNPHDQKPFMRD